MSELHNIVKDLIPLAYPVNLIHIDPANPRDGHDLEGIATSLKKYGQRKPIIVNKTKGHMIEAGTGTFRAATEILKWTHIAAVVVEDDENTSSGYNLADNRLTDLSYFDPEKMIAMALSVDEDIPGMESIKEMIMTVEDEPIYEPGEEDEDVFTNSLIFNLPPEQYGRFITIKDRLKIKSDEEVFITMLGYTEQSLEAL